MLSGPSPRAPKEPARPSTNRAPRLLGRCSTALGGSSVRTLALGLLRWPQRLPSRRGFYPETGLRADHPGNACAAARSEMDGGPSEGSPPPILCMKEEN